MARRTGSRGQAQGRSGIDIHAPRPGPRSRLLTPHAWRWLGAREDLPHARPRSTAGRWEAVPRGRGWVVDSRRSRGALRPSGPFTASPWVRGSDEAAQPVRARFVLESGSLGIDFTGPWDVPPR